MSFVADSDGPGEVAVQRGTKLREDDPVVQRFGEYFVPSPATADEIRRRETALMVAAGALSTAGGPR